MGSIPILSVLSETSVLVRKGDKVCALVGEAEYELSRYTCAGFDSDDSDESWFPRNKPKPLNIGVFKALRLDANQVL